MCLAKGTVSCLCLANRTGLCMCLAKGTVPCMCLAKGTVPCMCLAKGTVPCMCLANITAPCIYVSSQSHITRYVSFQKDNVICPAKHNAQCKCRTKDNTLLVVQRKHRHIFVSSQTTKPRHPGSVSLAGHIHAKLMFCCLFFFFFCGIHTNFLTFGRLNQLMEPRLT